MKKAFTLLCGAVALFAIAAAPRGQDPRKERLRVALKDVQPVGEWFYDDIDRGFAEAEKTKKPLMVVFR